MIKTVTTIFSLFIATIIALANSGVLGAHLGWLHAWPWGDKLAHFLLIGTLAGLVNLVLQGRQSRVWGRALPTGSLWVGVLVVLEEASQAWIPARSCSLVDLAADLGGILILGGLGAYWARKTPPTSESSAPVPSSYATTPRHCPGRHPGDREYGRCDADA